MNGLIPESWNQPDEIVTKCYVPSTEGPGSTGVLWLLSYLRNRRWGAAPSFAYGLGESTTFLLQYFHEQEDNTPDFGLPFVFGEPAPVKRDLYYGLPGDDRSHVIRAELAGTAHRCGTAP